MRKHKLSDSSKAAKKKLPKFTKADRELSKLMNEAGLADPVAEGRKPAKEEIKLYKELLQEEKETGERMNESGLINPLSEGRKITAADRALLRKAEAARLNEAGLADPVAEGRPVEKEELELLRKIESEKIAKEEQARRPKNRDLSAESYAKPGSTALKKTGGLKTGGLETGKVGASDKGKRKVRTWQVEEGDKVETPDGRSWIVTAETIGPPPTKPVRKKT